MRLLKTLSLLSLLFYLPIYAEELIPVIYAESLPIQENEAAVSLDPIPETPEPTLQELIAEVKNAPDEQKRVLMNQLKVHLKMMNKESRQKTMMELKKSFANKEAQQKDQQPKHETQQHANHQPKFRYLLQDSRNCSGSHQGEGQRGQGGNNHQGNGPK
jgi:predicted RNA-binding protein with RPS1 domain